MAAATLRPFNLFDLYKFSNVNLDALTETFDIKFYGTYISKWPYLCVCADNSLGDVMGYFLGKIEGMRDDYI